MTQFPIKLDGKALEVALGSGFLTRGGTDLQDCLLSALQQAWTCAVITGTSGRRGAGDFSFGSLGNLSLLKGVLFHKRP